MLLVAESDVVKCGAVVGHDGADTIIVFHPHTTERERERYARMLLTEGEMGLWREQQRVAG